MKKQDQLEELMQEKKWKLALKTIETRQKKGDKSDGLLVWHHLFIEIRSKKLTMIVDRSKR